MLKQRYNLAEVWSYLINRQEILSKFSEFPESWDIRWPGLPWCRWVLYPAQKKLKCQQWLFFITMYVHMIRKDTVWEIYFAFEDILIVRNMMKVVEITIHVNFRKSSKLKVRKSAKNNSRKIHELGLTGKSFILHSSPDFWGAKCPKCL